MLGLEDLIALCATLCCGYLIWTKVISDKVESPKNNPETKGLEKEELEEKIKDYKLQKKEIATEVKELETERKEVLKGDEEDKADQAKDKLTEKEEKQKELIKIETNLKDLEIVKEGKWKAQMPKMTLNNGLWIGGFLIALIIIWKILASLFAPILRSINIKEN